MIPKTPLVSVVIPVFNKEMTLARTLESIRAQTMTDYEVVIVDDGSTDRSLEIAKESDLPLCILKQENAGPSSARNRGIRESRGVYVAFLDADDMWDAAFLEECSAAFRRYPGVQALATGYRIERRGHAATRAPGTGRLPAGPVKDFFPVYSESRFCCSSASVVERDLLTRLGGFREDLWIGEDVELWCRIGAVATWGYVPKCLSTYCVDDPNSLSRSSSRVSRTADLWEWERDLVPMLSSRQAADYQHLRWVLLKKQMGILLRAGELGRFRAHGRAYRKQAQGGLGLALTCLSYLPRPVLHLVGWLYRRVLAGRRRKRA